MSELLEQAKKSRKFVKPELKITKWLDIESYFVDLRDRKITSIFELEKWMQDKSELESVLEEEMAWRYIRMNCDTQNAEYAQQFNEFVSEIDPQIQIYSNDLNKKLTESPNFSELNDSKYFILKRSILNSLELFREENVEIHAQLQQESQEYGIICSKQTITHNDKELTLQQAAALLKDNDRELRKTLYEKIAKRRQADVIPLNSLLLKLMQKRHQLAFNAGFSSYVEYRFKELARFDYTMQDCDQFHKSVKEYVVPIVAQLHGNRKRSLDLDVLKPWDLDVDPENKPPLKPFDNADELLQKTIACFDEIDSSFGNYLRIMKGNGHFDLDSRKGKAPGGFNYPLYESNAPFIYMNAAGTLRDVETMVHEGGHAIHSFLSSHLPLVDFKSLPSEVAELASMSMELISMEHWHHYFNNEEELKRAKRSQLEGIISILPWIMIVDSFQNYLYENQDKTSKEEIIVAWNNILNSFSDNQIDWTGYEWVRDFSWQKQLHIFEVPFYYIEYGISQLGAISIWKNYKLNPKRTIEQYKQALSLGYTVSIKEIYATAGIKFDFSEAYIKELMDFVIVELEKVS